MALELETESVLQQIQRVVAPYVGPRMAKTATELHCTKLGISEAQMSVDQAEALVARLAKAMRVLIGNEKTAELVELIRRTIELDGDRRQVRDG